MKRIAASVGLVALGTSMVQAADSGSLSALQTSKPWAVSVSLRGFYDDNINSSKNNKQDAFGIEINPSVNFGVAGEVTSASVGYSYQGKYYTHTPSGNAGPWDHTHIFDAALQHTFSPRLRMAVSDQFVIGQEPDTLRVDNVVVGPQRISGDNIRNYGTVIANIQATELVGFEVGYANSYFDYDDHSTLLESVPPAVATVSQPSRSGLLDRVENSAHVDARFHFTPQTVGLIGYMYSQTDYLGAEYVQGDLFALPTPIPFSRSSDRNSRSHFGYAGIEHTFSPNLFAALRAGIQYVDFYNNGNSSVSPYVEASARYFYGPESKVEVGVSHRRSTTDFIGATSLTVDADTTVVYASVVHRIVPNLFASLVGTFQYQTFNGGGVGANNEADRFVLLGIDFSYRFDVHWSAHAGYNFDYLDSDVSSRDFTRNRFYLGVTADY